MKKKKTNIVLTGMAGAGKSTIGKALAQRMALGFIDVDTLIEDDQHLPLQQILDTLGLDAFRLLEEKVLLTIDTQNHVIATGGSAIYSEAGIIHLKKLARLVFLDVPLPILQQRVGDFATRGLVKAENQSFAEVYAERLPLYQRHADHTVHCSDSSVDVICQQIITAFK